MDNSQVIQKKMSVTNLKGKELFHNYVSQRDYSESKNDEYAQLLITIRQNLPNDIFKLLIKAENAKKRLSIKYSESNILQSEITLEDIVLV